MSLFLIDWVLRLALIGVIVLRRRPVSTSLAWLALVVFLPVVGLILYLLVGENRLGRGRAAASERVSRELDAQAQRLWRHEDQATEEFTRLWGHIARFGTAVTGLPPLRGNKLSIHNDPDSTLRAMAADIDAATSHVHLLSYIWQPGCEPCDFADSLVRAAKRGVECRVLVDAVGSKPFFRSGDYRKLLDGGVKVVAALPVNPFRMLFARLDLRNHRKIAVIDGRTAYCGSQNITDTTFRSKRWIKTGPWVDSTMRIEGPAAQALGVIFLRDWLYDSDEKIESIDHLLPDLKRSREGHGSVVQVVPSGPGPSPEAIHQALLTTIYSAREELVMTTPYFVPDEAAELALAAAATRGVKVTVVMPRVSDSVLVAFASRSYYSQLMESGVRIMHFEGGLLHAKTITVDRKIGLIGSANFDARSFFLNFEVTVIVYDDDFAGVMRFMQTGYMDKSVDVDPAEWKQRAVWRMLLENTARLTGPLL